VSGDSLPGAGVRSEDRRDGQGAQNAHVRELPGTGEGGAEGDREIEVSFVIPAPVLRGPEGDRPKKRRPCEVASSVAGHSAGDAPDGNEGAQGEETSPWVAGARRLQAFMEQARKRMAGHPSNTRVPRRQQRPTPEVSRAILAGRPLYVSRGLLISTSWARWAARYAKEQNAHPKMTATAAVMVFADMELEAGQTLDWACAMAAEEQIPLGTWIAQVVQQYRDDFVAQEARARTLEIRRRRFARIQAAGMALNPRSPLVAEPDAVPHRDRPHNDQD